MRLENSRGRAMQVSGRPPPLYRQVTRSLMFLLREIYDPPALMVAPAIFNSFLPSGVKENTRY